MPYRKGWAAGCTFVLTLVVAMVNSIGARVLMNQQFVWSLALLVSGITLVFVAYALEMELFRCITDPLKKNKKKTKKTKKNTESEWKERRSFEKSVYEVCGLGREQKMSGMFL